MYQKYNFENLEIYQLGIELVQKIYLISEKFPKEETFCLTSQTRRAIISYVLNVVEGSGRGSRKDFSRFINQAIGSLLEVKGCLIIAKNLKYITVNDFDKIMPEIDKLFFKSLSFKKSLQNK